MPVGNITGLSSGVDWGETIQLLMQLERRPIDLLETRRSTFQTKLTNWNLIETKLNALKSAAESVDEMSEFLLKAGSSNDTDILTVTANDMAISGSHDIIVNQLATHHVHTHRDGWADADTTPVNDSGDDQSFSYSYAGTDYTVTVPDGSTLTDLVTLINNDNDNPGVSASILNDGSGGAAAYHLVLAGNDTGEDNTISIVDTIPNPTDLGDGSQFDEAAWATTQTAQNAELRVDGFPDPGWGWPNPWIESETNTVTDIIPGVTLNLKDDSGGGSVRIEISVNSAAIKSNVNSFINAYNDLVGQINTLTSYNAEDKIAGPLFGDPLARSIRSDLMGMVGSTIPGTVEGDTYRSVGQAGVSLASGGLLTLDDEEFDEALEADPTAIARLFAFDAETSDNFVSVSSHTSNTVGGVYNFTLTYNASGELDSGGTNTINGVAGVIHGANFLEGAEDDDSEGLLLKLTNPGDGPSSISGTVTVITGMGVLFANKIEDILDSDEGSLTFTRDMINDSVDMLDDRIETWERRLEAIEKTYERKFIAMELLIGQMRTVGSYLDQAL